MPLVGVGCHFDEKSLSLRCFHDEFGLLARPFRCGPNPLAKGATQNATYLARTPGFMVSGGSTSWRLCEHRRELGCQHPHRPERWDWRRGGQRRPRVHRRRGVGRCGTRECGDQWAFAQPCCPGSSRRCIGSGPHGSQSAKQGLMHQRHGSTPKPQNFGGTMPRNLGPSQPQSHPPFG
jgi:hypothetical protein